MDASSFNYALLLQWSAQSPALLIYFLGVIVALTYWQSHRLAAALTLCAMILLTVLTLSVPVVTLSLPQWQSEHSWSLKQMGFVSTAIGLSSSVSHALSIGLLLAAVFFRRPVPVVSAPSNLPPPLPIP